MFTDELEMLWATPIAIRVFDEIQDLNAYLEGKILELKELDYGISKSNCLGWHSTGNLFQILPSELNEFHKMIVQFISDYIAELNPNRNQVDVELFAWANILDKGGYHNVHTHPSSHLSGVYYINPGEPDPQNLNSGLIGFSDPRDGASMIANSYLDYGASYQYKPETGMLLMFPSYLSHWVHPFTGNGKRITISFNAKFLEPLKN
ncbi:MAG TPA: 2OG-Fe(II) oxygenase family protein [Allocoleopsis sp.]